MTLIRTAIWLLAALVAALTFPDDGRPAALCPNYDTVVVTPTPWEGAHGRRTRTMPSSCTDTTAVTFGYLR